MRKKEIEYFFLQKKKIISFQFFFVIQKKKIKMASLVLFVNGEEKSISDFSSENERESIKQEIESKFFHHHGRVEVDESIFITMNGNLDTNLPTNQIPREIYTIHPQHSSFQNKLVQLRFKLDGETEQQTTSRNQPFHDNYSLFSQSISTSEEREETVGIGINRNISSSIPRFQPPRPGGPPPPSPQLHRSDAITDASIDMLDAWDPP